MKVTVEAGIKMTPAIRKAIRQLKPGNSYVVIPKGLWLDSKNGATGVLRRDYVGAVLDETAQPATVDVAATDATPRPGWIAGENLSAGDFVKLGPDGKVVRS